MSFINRVGALRIFCGGISEPVSFALRQAAHEAFEGWRRAQGLRLLLLTTRAHLAHHRLAYRPGDVLLAGRESAGVPEEVRAAADALVRVPMAPGLRSLNVVTALALVLGEALRQTGGFPPESEEEP